MIEQLINTAEALIQQFGIWGVFMAALIEEIVAPIPSGLVMMSSGYAFLAGSPTTISNILYLGVSVALPLAFGLTLGSLLVYTIAYKWGEPIIRKVGPWFAISWNDIMRVHSKFDRTHRDEYVLLALRMIPILPSVAINAVAGLLKFNLRPYIFITFLGTFIRGFMISFAGWQLGTVYKEYAHVVDNWSDYVFYLIILLVVGFVAWRKLKK